LERGDLSGLIRCQIFKVSQVVIQLHHHLMADLLAGRVAGVAADADGDNLRGGG
jgi:hypothetical protein